ncbi:MAG: hypothetical protein IPK78_04255 [Rhodospirillales bacterium]|nr:hypothetical protein [Rhodospirillales bacterium]
MPNLPDSSTRHVRRAVVAHDFLDAEDWASGVGALATFTDDEIETLVRDELGELFVFEEEAGVTPAQAKADRALFQQRTKAAVSA